MWGDDDWRALSLPAQHLYLHLLTSPTLSYAGIADWRPARLAGVSAGATTKSITAAADELQDKLFVIRDDETEEILVRSFLKHDGLMQKPNVAKAMVAAFTKAVSPTLRGVIVFELAKLFARVPEWRAFDLPEVQEILSRPSVNPSEIPKPKGSIKGSEFDPSLLTTNYSLLTTDSTQLATPPNEVRDDVMGLCLRLQQWIVDNGSKEPTINKGWLDAARLLLDKDGRNFDASLRLIDWCQQDHFWKPNILSMPTFREKYDQLRLAANREREERRAKPTPTERAMTTLSLATDIEMAGLES
jgi:hypothetical protein